MKLGDNKGKKIAEPFFEKNSHFAQIWPNVKMAIFGQNRSFWDIAIKLSQQIFLRPEGGGGQALKNGQFLHSFIR